MKNWLRDIYHIWLGYMAGVIVSTIPISILYLVYGAPEYELDVVFILSLIPAWYVCRRVHRYYGLAIW